MPFVAVNIVKVLFVVAIYAFLFYVARSMRGHLVGPPQSRAPAASMPTAAPRTAEPILVVVAESGEESTHPIRDRVVIGRGASADIQLDDEYASEHHARIESADGRIWVEDLGSTNGSTLDGARLESRAELRPGTTLVVGRTKVTVR